MQTPHPPTSSIPHTTVTSHLLNSSSYYQKSHTHIHTQLIAVSFFKPAALLSFPGRSQPRRAWAWKTRTFTITWRTWLSMYEGSMAGPLPPPVDHGRFFRAADRRPYPPGVQTPTGFWLERRHGFSVNVRGGGRVILFVLRAATPAASRRKLGATNALMERWRWCKMSRWRDKADTILRICSLHLESAKQCRSTCSELVFTYN